VQHRAGADCEQRAGGRHGWPVIVGVAGAAGRTAPQGVHPHPVGGCQPLGVIGGNAGQGFRRGFAGVS
jgi:hypothetical protein